MFIFKIGCILCAGLLRNSQISSEPDHWIGIVRSTFMRISAFKWKLFTINTACTITYLESHQTEQMQVAPPWRRPQEGETPVARDQELSLQGSTAVHCGPSCQGSGALTTLRCQGSLHQSKFSSLKSRSFSSRRQPIFSHTVAILAVQWTVFTSVQT